MNITDEIAQDSNNPDQSSEQERQDEAMCEQDWRDAEAAASALAATWPLFRGVPYSSGAPKSERDLDAVEFVLRQVGFEMAETTPPPVHNVTRTLAIFAEEYGIAALLRVIARSLEVK